tara:strand:- start:3137 stop:3376 length:240 start_codon:yes stop_codon:yes gene_type:complete
MASKMNLRNAKLVGIALSVIVILILIFQNRASVDTRVLFVTITMPRAVLLVVMLAVGFVLGLLTAIKTRTGTKREPGTT